MQKNVANMKGMAKYRQFKMPASIKRMFRGSQTIIYRSDSPHFVISEDGANTIFFQGPYYLVSSVLHVDICVGGRIGGYARMSLVTNSIHFVLYNPINTDSVLTERFSSYVAKTVRGMLKFNPSKMTLTISQSIKPTPSMYRFNLKREQ